MKKLLCAVLTTGIVLSAGFMVTYADNGKGKSGDSSGKSESKSSTTVQVTDTTDTTTPATGEQTPKPTVDSLKAQLKEQHSNKETRKELIQQIYELKKQNKEESKMIFVNGKEVVSDVPPVLKYGRTLIPVRAITNALGAEVAWDAATNTVTITKEGTVIEIVLGNTTAKVNGEEVKLDVPAELYNSRTIVPVRFISETFKKQVEYDPGTGTVIIEDGTSTDTTTGTGTTPTIGTDTGTTPSTGADTTTSPGTGTDTGTTPTTTTEPTTPTTSSGITDGATGTN
ncbi:MAG: copper amine oxidase N-terminal domain-containing protein [Clostridia bacterium]|nr:copper amine oxidase N-terminal domain-containing protein [Clostridia bacterium]